MQLSNALKGALLLAALFGCDRGNASTTATAAPTAATPLTRSDPGQEVSPGIEVTNICSVGKGLAIVQALVPTTVTTGPTKGKVERDVWRITCSQKGKSCSGAMLNIDGLEKTHKLSFDALVPLGNVSLESLDGDVAVIKWGPYRTITVDAGKKHVVVEYRAGADEQSVGEGDCSTDIGAAMRNSP